VLGLSFLTIKTIIPSFYLFSSRFLAWCLIFLYFAYIQAGIFFLLKTFSVLVFNKTDLILSHLMHKKLGGAN
jgi:hypothetical protein